MAPKKMRHTVVRTCSPRASAAARVMAKLGIAPRDPARIAHERHGGRHDGARRARDAPLAMIRARQRRRVLSAHVDTRDAVFDEARGGRTENT